jgi:hypothetical protein
LKENSVRLDQAHHWPIATRRKTQRGANAGSVIAATQPNAAVASAWPMARESARCAKRTAAHWPISQLGLLNERHKFSSGEVPILLSPRKIGAGPKSQRQIGLRSGQLKNYMAMIISVAWAFKLGIIPGH